MPAGPPSAIVFVLPSLAGGGAERVALTLAAGLKQRGRDVRLVLLTCAGPLGPLVDPAIPVTDLERPRLRAALPRLLAALRAIRPAAVFSTFGYVNLALAGMKPLLPRSTRLFFREANLPSANLALSAKPALMRAAHRYAFARAHRVLATSRRMADEMTALFGVPPAKIALLPNPVDETALRNATPRREPGDGLRFVGVGRLTHQKGFDRLLPLLPETARLVLLGDGPDRAALTAQAAALGCAERVTFLGFRDDAAAWIAGADALLLPSRWEGVPNAALEALALGTPVIGTPEAGGLAEIGSAGLTIAALPDAFAAAMRTIAPAPAAALRPSLLPAAYCRETVVAQLDALLGPAP